MYLKSVVFLVIYYIKIGRRLHFPRYVLGYGINEPATIIHIASPTSDVKLSYMYWQQIEIENKRQADVSEKMKASAYSII